MMANRRQFHEWVAVRPQPLARLVVMTAAVLLTGLTASADTIYWTGTGTTWSPAGNWSTDPNATTPAPAAVPGAADDAVFNITTLADPQTIGLSNANQAARSLTFNSTGTVTFGGGGNRDLAIGVGGITVAATAGAATIGGSSPSFNVFVRITADQTWTNNSASQLRAVNAASAASSGTTPVTLTVRNTGTGATTFSNQLNNGAGGAALSLVVDSPGTGVLNLAGGNFSGGTTIRQGTVSTSTIGTGGIVLGDAAGGDSRLNVSAAISNAITVKAGTGLRGLTGSATTTDFQGPITLERDVSIGSVSSTTQTFTVSGAISGTGTVTIGRLPGGSNNPVVTLSGSNSYPGRTTVESATLVVSSLNKVVGGSATSNLGAPTTVADGTISLGASAASTLRYTGTGETTDRVLDLAGATNGVTLEQAGTGSLTFTSNVTTSGNGNKTLTLRGATAGIGEIAGVISNSTGTTTLAKLDSGTWRLSGLNTYTGNTTISAGVLEVTHLANAGQPSSLGAPASTAGPTVLNGASTLRYVGSGGSTNRVLTIGGGGGGTLDASGSGPIQFTNTSTSAFGSSNVAYVLNLAGTNSGANTYGANQGNNGSGAFSLVKGGTGTWVLSGASTYTGTTTVSGGTLVVGDGTKGSLGNTAVTVGAGGTLAGTGPIAGSVTVASGGTLSPGNSPGSQAVGSLAWAGGGNYNWQVLDAAGSAGIGYDTYAVSGSLDLSALTSGDPFNINLWSLASSGPDVGGNAANFNSALAQSWTLVSTPTPIAGFGSDLFQVNVGAVNGTSGFTNSLGGGSFGVTLGDGGTDLMLSFTPVPEPGSLLLVAVVGAAMVSLRRRSPAASPA